MIGRSVAYRKTEETDLLRSKRGSGGVWRIAKRRKRTCVGALRSKRGSCSSGGVWRTAKRDSMGYCSSPTSTSSSLHGLLFIHRRPPPAFTCDCSPIGSCSSTVDLLQPPPATVHPWAPVHPASTTCSSTGYYTTTPLHGVLFNHPSTGYCSSSPPWGPVHPALHGILFIHPSTGSSSSTPPQGPVHPQARLIGVFFIQRQLPLLPRGPVHPTPPHRELFIQPPAQQHPLFI